MRRKALQEEIDRESGKTEASDTKTWTVSLPLGSLRSLQRATPFSPCGVEGQEAKSLWPRGSPSLPAGSLLHRARLELISFLLEEVLASRLESWMLEISCLDLYHLLCTGAVSWAPVSRGT